MPKLLWFLITQVKFLVEVFGRTWLDSINSGATFSSFTQLFDFLIETISQY